MRPSYVRNNPPLRHFTGILGASAPPPPDTPLEDEHSGPQFVDLSAPPPK